MSGETRQTIDGIEFEHLGYHSTKHWVNIVPASGLGLWYIVGFKKDKKQVGWTGFTWTEEHSLVATFSWEAACRHVKLAIESKLETMR